MSQINIDPALTLGLPLDITDPTEITGATQNALVIGSATGALVSLPLALDGEVLIGSTGNAPSWANITSVGGTVVFSANWADDPPRRPARPPGLGKPVLEASNRHAREPPTAGAALRSTRRSGRRA